MYLYLCNTYFKCVRLYFLQQKPGKTLMILTTNSMDVRLTFDEWIVKGIILSYQWRANSYQNRNYIKP